MISPIDCKHKNTIFIQGSNYMGVDTDHGRDTVSVCADCGQFSVWGDKNGVHFSVTFTLPTDELVQAAGRYARYLAKEEPKRNLSPSEIRDRIGSWTAAMNAVRDGLNGYPFTWTAGELDAHRPKLAAMGITLVTKTQVAKLGYRLRRGAQPVGRGYFRSPISRSANLYVLECQCTKESEEK